MKKILSILATIFVGAFLALTPVSVFAEGCDCENGEGVSTSILGGGCVCDDGSGDSIKNILRIVVDVLTVGVGILAVIGIVIVGIQYLTAADNEEQVRKAKRRLFEIIIGIVAYVLIYALVGWLLPGNPFEWISVEVTQASTVAVL